MSGRLKALFDIRHVFTYFAAKFPGITATKESSINKGINYGIPLGMHRSVEQSIPHVLHPVRDASLPGCKTERYGFSTERCIPNGMLFALTALPAGR
jgi:hypothetical protein